MGQRTGSEGGKAMRKPAQGSRYTVMEVWVWSKRERLLKILKDDSLALGTKSNSV